MSEHKQDAPIAERWADTYKTVYTSENPDAAILIMLIEELSASEQRERVVNQRLDSMAHEPFNTPEELMQDLIRENSEFTNTIVKLRERERVLREKAQIFVAKLDEVEPAINNAFAFQHIHGMNYTGPTYGLELADLRAALAPEQPAAPCEPAQEQGKELQA